MARFSAAWRTAGAGSTTLPIGSLYATAACRPKIVEIGVFNTTATGLVVALRRLSTTGTQGSTITAVGEDDPTQAAVATAKDTHTVAPTLVAGILRTKALAAVAGDGVIWTFGGGQTPGVVLTEATTNGLGIIIASGTGQICDVYFVWTE